MFLFSEQDLSTIKKDAGKLFEKPFLSYPKIQLDFTAENENLRAALLADTQKFNNYVFEKIKASNCKIGWGGYLENRVIYKRSTHFDSLIESRSIHLGIDIWANPGTKVFSPFDGFIHSKKDNNNFGDYGPTVITTHRFNNISFYLLFGHLSRASLDEINSGKPLKKGQKIGEIGDFPENGDWPPHLHFQVILDLMGNFGDFPGVCSVTEKDFYSNLCPNPICFFN